MTRDEIRATLHDVVLPATIAELVLVVVFIVAMVFVYGGILSELTR